MTDHQQQHQPWLPPSAPAYGPPPTQAPEWPPRDSHRLSGLRKALGPLFVIVALLAKFGKGAFVVLKGAKFLTTSVSMIVSVAAYAVIWGWKFAVGFVLLLFIHEMGHYIQLRREGVKP